jgi:rfaE bifunctional protein nucleotidyltransferase chain/domain
MTETVTPSHRHPDGGKLHTVAGLAAIAEQLRREGRTVVLCHGVFDLLHLGHVRHLEAARREGDVLMVTITADSFVNKGPGRPVFGEHQRAEMLAALAHVDHVGINHAISAETVIHAIKPGVYVKGSDYKDSETDVTGKIAAERMAVEEHGGRVVFTNELVFSSSSLINNYLDVHDPALKDYLAGLRQRDGLQQVRHMLDRAAGLKVLVVGDAIIDDYQYVSALGKSPKENMIATLHREGELFAGGCVAAANHVANFCAEVEVVTVLGRQDSHEALIRDSLLPNVTLTALHRDGAPTTRKCRFIDNGMRKLFEVYYMDDTPSSGRQEAELVRVIANRAPKYDLVIVTDFGHGMITAPVIKALVENARFLAVNTQTNSANTGFNLVTRYPRADYVCIDAPEAKLATGDRYSDISTILAKHLPARIACNRITVTMGHEGAATWAKGKKINRVPAFTKRALDTVGAGDAFLAVTSPLVAVGGPMDLVGFVGNAVGAIKVGIVGHRRSVGRIELIKFVERLLK